MDLTVKGRSCVECLYEITEKFKNFSFVEKASMDTRRKKAIFQGDTSVPQKQFLGALADIPYFFKGG